MEELLLNTYRWALVAFGIGLVIFVHELGHFLAARWCGVRVETFSLGFGPRLLGWRRGSTTYQIAAVPLGGFVKMAGEEGAVDGRPAAADELPAKSVGQRFLIYSGGVIMNVVFALIVFPIILGIGVSFPEPMIGPTTPGSPAWHAGLQAGTRVESVNGNGVYSFMNIPNEVALGSTEETVLVVRDPGATTSRTVRLVPQWSESQGIYSIGANPAVDPKGTIEVAKGSSAERAGLRNGDRLVEIVGSSKGLTLEEQYAQMAREGGPIQGRFERDGAAFEATVVPEPSPAGEARLLGVGPLVRKVVAVRNTPLGRATGLTKDDVILDVDGRLLARHFDFISALEAAKGPVKMRVERGGSVQALEIPVLAPGDAVAMAQDVALGQDTESNAVAITPGSAAEQAGMHDGDRIVRIDEKPVTGFTDVQTAAKDAGKDEELTLDVDRAGESVAFRLAPRAWRPPSYGFGVQDAQYFYRANGPVDAVRDGFALSWKFLQESWLTLKRILFRQVSGQNLGGIITIGVVSHSFAATGLTKLFYFLCMLSMNLAFLNVLPIPVLDGGHLLFLLIEKLKGSPVSERVHGYSQLVGVVLIVSLMVYVTFNDVVRWIVR